MLLYIILIIVGFALLIVGADFLVDGASGIAKKFHIPEIIIGLTIVSIGTSMPELFVSITSAIDGYSDMALGNVIGSNLCNLLLILGLSSLIKPVDFQEETRKYEIPMCLLFTIILMIFSNTSGGISRIEAVILLVLFVLFIAYTIYMGKKKSKEDSKVVEEKNKNKTIKNIILIILGIVGLKFGGDFVVNNAVNIAKMFNISEKVISLTILAIGTSLPELVTSVTAAIKGNSDIAIGNIIGSNIFNILLILGVSSVIKPITFNSSYNMDLSILCISTVILALFPIIPPKNKMSRVNGLIYVLMYGAYMTMLFLG
ncbi:MAG TPA: calcium/sodium antiporter [Clostridiaceae bacterium]|jgi:cation:H+ antiporter|nr:calcium/sodium antiporter [Clostridiaceae bacterium]